MTGADIYGGGTTISAGMLQLGNGAASGSIPGNILDNAALGFANALAQAYSGTIAGSGAAWRPVPAR